jgi:hypothetical protein
MDAKERLFIEQLITEIESWRDDKNQGYDEALLLLYEIQSDLEALLQSVRSVTPQEPKKCLTCEGHGVRRNYLDIAGDYEKYHCPDCGGTGLEAVTTQEPESEYASEAEYQNHLPWCKARLFGRLNRSACNCDLAATKQNPK